MSTRIFINIKTHVYGSSNNVNTRLTTFMCIISRTRLGARRWNSAGVTWTSWTSCWRPGTRRGPASPDSRSATRSTHSSLKARFCFCGLCILILICWYFLLKKVYLNMFVKEMYIAWKFVMCRKVHKEVYTSIRFIKSAKLFVLPLKNKVIYRHAVNIP